MRKRIYKLLIAFLLISNSLLANEATNWLKTEIDYILDAYQDNSITAKERFAYIENTCASPPSLDPIHPFS